MARIHVEASGTINAPPEKVYSILAEYREGRPRILPEENFSELEVEEGGRGAGTIIRFRMRVGGAERSYRMLVSEPEPGRVLQEDDTTSSAVTTFTVTPEDDGKKSHVRIATEWDSASGLMGILERVTAPTLIRAVYQKELQQLAEVATSTPDQSRAVARSSSKA